MTWEDEPDAKDMSTKEHIALLSFGVLIFLGLVVMGLKIKDAPDKYHDATLDLDTQPARLLIQAPPAPPSSGLSGTAEPADSRTWQDDVDRGRETVRRLDEKRQEEIEEGAPE